MTKLEEIVNTADGQIKTEARSWFEFLTHSDMNFDGKRDDETILVFTRRHWLILASPVVGGAVASVLPLAAVILGAKILVTYNLSGVFTLFWTLYIMTIWFFVFYRITMHALDTWIVTNERIVDILQIRLFTRKVSELHLESIQDISVNTTGVIESYFDFGNIEIQTGATAQRFSFEKVPHPLLIKDSIMDAADKFQNDTKKS